MFVPHAPMTPDEWLIAATDYHITIKDIEELPVGKTIHIFFMSKNLLKKCRCGSGKEIKPTLFFKDGYYISFTKSHGIRGKWRFSSNPNKYYMKDFDVSVDGQWYNLKRSLTPYQDLPENTKLGWRGGPMMLVQNMDRCPNILC